jgi:release factor glutamine methyltransferase
VDGKYDVIVSNPPYIETETVRTLDRTVKDFEPLTALDGGKDGLIFYRRISEISKDILNNNGFIIFEIGYNQGIAVSDILKENGFKDVEVIKDFCDNDRVVKGRKTI